MFSNVNKPATGMRINDQKTVRTAMTAVMDQALAILLGRER